MLIRKLVVVGSFCFSFAAYGDQLRCNRDQSKCLVREPGLTIGDKVGIVNEYDELVAVGNVDRLDGQRRSLRIRDAKGPILKQHRLVLLTTPDGSTSTTKYNTFYKPDEERVGGHLGIATIGIGEGTPGFEASGFWEMRRSMGYNFVARGTYLMGQGTLSRFTDANVVESGTFQMHTLAATGGMSYTLLPRKPIQLRGEAGIGPAYVMAGIDGDSSLVSGQGYATNITNGFHIIADLRASLISRIGDWDGEIGAQQSILYRATVTSLSIGAMRKLK